MKETYKFCLALLKLGTQRCRAMTNYVMGLCSSPCLCHPVEVTNSPFGYYTYRNLTKVLSFWNLSNEVFLKFSGTPELEMCHAKIPEIVGIRIRICRILEFAEFKMCYAKILKIVRIRIFRILEFAELKMRHAKILEIL